MDAISWLVIIVLCIAAIILIIAVGIAVLAYLFPLAAGVFLIYGGIKIGGILGAAMLILGVLFTLLVSLGMVWEIKIVTNWSDDP